MRRRYGPIVLWLAAIVVAALLSVAARAAGWSGPTLLIVAASTLTVFLAVGLPLAIGVEEPRDRARLRRSRGGRPARRP